MLRYIYEKLLEDSVRLFLLDLKNEVVYVVDKNFFKSPNDIYDKPINMSKWCACYCEEYVCDNDTKAFVDLVNPYILNDNFYLTPEHKTSLLFLNRHNEWRYASVQPFETNFLILKIEKIEMTEFATKLISSLRISPPSNSNINSSKDFENIKKELEKNPPASMGIVYLKAREGNKDELEFGKNLLVQIFEQENCYMFNNKTVLALLLNLSPQDFQYNIIELYSKINHSDFIGLNIGSHWSNDEEEEIPYLLDKAIYKLIHD